MKDSLDVWNISDDLNDLQVALSKLEIGSRNNILYSNCESTIKLGQKVVSVNRFEAVFYGDESDILIFLEKDGNVKLTDMRRELNKTGCLYHEIVYASPDLELTKKNVLDKEVIFIRDRDSFNKYALDSYNKGFNTCVYYPNVDGLLDYGTFMTKDDFYKFDGNCVKGVVVFGDKLLLLSRQKKRVVKSSEIYIRLEDIGIIISVDPGAKIQFN